MELTSRLAVNGDVPALEAIMDEAIGTLQEGFLTSEQIAASRAFMGLDGQLIADGTYYVIEIGGEIAGCGGWSRRATLFGSDHTPGRDAHLLDPAVDPARVRAMYTKPSFARRGVGRRILELCEAAAAAEGFTRLQLMGTMSGGAALHRIRLHRHGARGGRGWRSSSALCSDGEADRRSLMGAEHQESLSWSGSTTRGHGRGHERPRAFRHPRCGGQPSHHAGAWQRPHPVARHEPGAGGR